MRDRIEHTEHRRTARERPEAGSNNTGSGERFYGATAPADDSEGRPGVAST